MSYSEWFTVTKKYFDNFTAVLDAHPTLKSVMRVSNREAMLCSIPAGFMIAGEIEELEWTFDYEKHGEPLCYVELHTRCQLVEVPQ